MFKPAEDIGLQEQLQSEKEDSIKQNIFDLISVKKEESDQEYQDNPEFTDTIGIVKLEHVLVKPVKSETESKPLLEDFNSIEDSIKIRTEEIDRKSEVEEEILAIETVQPETESKSLWEFFHPINDILKTEEIVIKSDDKEDIQCAIMSRNPKKTWGHC